MLDNNEFTTKFEEIKKLYPPGMLWTTDNTRLRPMLKNVQWLIEQVERIQVENNNLKSAIDYIDECPEGRSDGN